MGADRAIRKKSHGVPAESKSYEVWYGNSMWDSYDNPRSAAMSADKGCTIYEATTTRRKIKIDVAISYEK